MSAETYAIPKPYKIHKSPYKNFSFNKALVWPIYGSILFLAALFFTNHFNGVAILLGFSIPLTLNRSSILKKRPKRQEFKGLYLENGAFYINKIENILKNKNRLSGRIGIFEMEEYKFIEIDEELDWKIAEYIMREKILLKSKPRKIKLFATDVDGTLIEICKKEGISLEEVAYIGDDTNCKDLLEALGIKACLSNSVGDIKEIPGIIVLKRKGGEGAVREFIEIILKDYK